MVSEVLYTQQMVPPGVASPPTFVTCHVCHFKGRKGRRKRGGRQREGNRNLISHVTTMILSYSLFSGTRRVHANEVYQQYIKDKNHFHMNATRVGGHITAAVDV